MATSKLQKSLVLPGSVCVNHFSHKHPLLPVGVREKNEIICDGCGLGLSGLAFKCSKSKCNFFLHKSCFNLKPQILHRSHPDHPLTLLASSPYNPSNSFICSACSEFGTGFLYHCSICEFDLHVGCASLPMAVEHAHHEEHPLTLFYSVSYICEVAGFFTFTCDVCREIVPDKNNWVYYCDQCNYGAHLRCVNRVPPPKPWFQLETVVRHILHPQHPLILLPSPPKNYSSKSFLCNACNLPGFGFDYNCPSCHFDLHIDCALLPESVMDRNHEHPLTLCTVQISSPYDEGCKCQACHGDIINGRWAYYCELCMRGIHILCARPMHTLN